MHNNIEEYTKERFVAVLDIMGFKSMVEKNKASDIYKIMRRIYDETSEVREYTKLNTIVFSDSIFIISEDDGVESFQDIVIITARFMRFLKEGFAVNGSVSFGNVTYDEERNIVFGKPINEAHKCQEKLFCYSLVLNKSVVDKIKNNSNYFFFQYIPDLILDDVDVYFKNNNGYKIEKHSIINWCELYCYGTQRTYENQITEIRRDLIIVLKGVKNNERAIQYIKHTEKMLCEWFNFTNTRQHWIEIDYPEMQTI